MKTPYLPAEWAPQSALLLTWPHAGIDWQLPLDVIEAPFIQIASLTSQYQHVIISCLDDAQREHISQQLQQANANMSHISCYCIPSNDIWVRDHGPITVFDEQHRGCLLDFEFNGWGGKFPATQDNHVTQRLVQAGAFAGYQLQPISLVLEGGSIETDGHGLLLSTRHCLLHHNRNPSLDEHTLTETLRTLLGVEHVVLLKHGLLIGDDTDGHIDTLARFCDPYTLCYVSCDDPHDPQYNELTAMKAELSALRNCQNKPYHLVELPLPKPLYAQDGRRLPATYANFIITNQHVFVPSYADLMDSVALTQLTSCFANRDVISISSEHLITQSGSLHCASMHIPAPRA